MKTLTLSDLLIETPTFILTTATTSVIINEYSVRNIMMLISQGHLTPEDITITDLDGVVADIRPDGIMRNELRGMDINTNLSMQTIRRA